MQTKYRSGLNITSIIVSLFFLLVSCEDSYFEDISKITNNNGINPEIVINGGITSEKKYQEITLTKPLLLDEHIIDSISGATVNVKIGDIYYEFVEEINHLNSHTLKKRKGTYISVDSIKGTPGANHTLTVNYAGKTYTASDRMVEVSPFDFSSIELPVRKPGGIYESGVLVIPILALQVFNFGTEKTNIYNWYSRDTIFELDDKITAAVYNFAIVDQQGLLSEMYMELYNTVHFWLSSKITVEKLSISKQYEEYLISMLKETFWNTNLFSTTPANLPTNVSTGGIGFFYASDTYKQTITASEFLKLYDLNE